MKPSLPLRSAVLALLLAGCAHAPREPAQEPVGDRQIGDGQRATLAVLETTDVHSNVLSYDYYKLAEDDTLGYERLATLVREARGEYANTLLFDAGDTIQGTALADWQALVEPLPCDHELAMYKAMDALGYDGGTIGNHEFNYGLPFLAQATNRAINADGVTPRECKGPGFPLVLANVFSTRDGKPIYPPYAVLERRLKLHGADGRETEAPIRIGIIGFTPPPILDWDKRNLEGRVTTRGVVEAAREYVPKLRAEGVDFVIAISHGGINTAPYTGTMENANWYLAQEPGVDVLLLGHSHAAFPDGKSAKPRYDNLADVDNQRGFIHGKPAVMGNFWGKSLGVIELGLVRRDGRWQIDADASHSEVRDIRRPDGSVVPPDPTIAAQIAAEHAATIAYVSTPIGDSDFAMTSYFADVGDVSALQPVNTAQREYVERYLRDNLPDLADVPVLSAAAAFKGGFGGPTDYTDIEPGPLAIRNAADLYLYPNTLAAVKIDGATLKGWLERAAGRFNRIDPARTEPQELINRRFPGYNFDVVQGGVTYAIDVTAPEGQRIVDLRFRGAPVQAAQPFVIVTNNYRASGGGHFPGADGNGIVVSSPDANRDVLIAWVRQHQHLTRAQNGSDRNWRFAKVRTAGPVTYVSATGKLELARAAGLDYVRVLKDNGDGTTTYAIDLAKVH